MRRVIERLGLTSAAVFLVVGAAGSTASTPVVSRVGNAAITSVAWQEEVNAWLADRPYVNPSDPIERQAALARLEERQLLALGALAEIDRAEALGDSVRRLATLEEVWEILRSELYAPATALTDSALRVFREERTALYYGRHIVLDTAEEAAAVLKRLESGESFDALAKEVSVDIGTAAAGGRMFPVRRGDTYAPIFHLLETLEPGEFGGPVRSQMGIHVAVCDSITHGLEDEEIAPTHLLRVVRRRMDYLEKCDAWVAQHVEKLGIVLDEDAVRTVYEHLRPTAGNRLPPHRDPSWTPTDAVLCSARDGARITVREFFETFHILGIDDWARARNLNTIRSAAQRLMMVWIAASEMERGTRAFPEAASARVAAKVNRFLGQRFLDVTINPGTVDSARAEKVFVEYPDHFQMPESISIAAIGVTTQNQADEIYSMVQAGTSFEAAAARAAELDPNAVYAPTTPFIPKGQFPDTDGLLFSLEPGQVTPPMRVPKGFQIYRIVQKRTPRPLRRVELSDETLLERADEVLRIEQKKRELERLRAMFPVKRDEKAIQSILDGTRH